MLSYFAIDTNFPGEYNLLNQGASEQMTKPTVFISHSSRDEKMVRKLKGLLDKKVGNTLDIFVSSDGQSIPLGRNWVYEIEKALKNSKIMFVLLSPNSIRSNWIYFEAGFAYSNDIKVIPIGILGIDLSQVLPPMSLLQGFNINSVESLNNLVSVINREFNYSLEASFTYEEYAEIFGIQRTKENAILKEYLPLVNEVSAQIAFKVDEPIRAVAEHFKSRKVEYQSEDSMVDTYGVSIQKQDNLLLLSIDPESMDLTIPLIGEIVKIVLGSSFEFYPLTLDFVPSVSCIEGKHKVSSKIYQTEITIVDNYNFGYSDIAFNIGRRTYLRSFAPYSGGWYTVGVAAQGLNSFEYESGNVFMETKYYGNDFAGIPIHKLLSRLFELGILY